MENNKALKEVLLVLAIPVLAISIFMYGYWAGSENIIGGTLNKTVLMIVSSLGLFGLIVGLLIKTEK